HQTLSWPRSQSHTASFVALANVRKRVLKQALLQASGTVLLPAFLPEVFSDRPSEDSSAPTAEQDVGFRSFIRQQLSSDASDLYEKMHREVDRIFLTLVLDQTQGSQRQAARVLGIARQTLRQKLRDLGLHVTHSVEAEEDD